MQREEHSSYFCTLLQQDEVVATSKVRLDNGKNSHPLIISEEVQEPPSLATRKDEIRIHEEKHKLLQGICSEGEGEVSHGNKEKYVVAMEDMNEILNGEYFPVKEQSVHSANPATSDVEK